MNEMIPGASLSTYKTMAMTIGQSKKENRDGVKSKFVILTVKDKGSMIAKKSRLILFEDDLFSGAIDVLKNYAMTDADGQKIKDARGGYPIDLKKLKEGEDHEDFDGLFILEGGMVMDYRLKKGPCYANDIDGKRVKDGRGNDVIKDTVSVFVQVKYFMPTPQGGLQPVFYAGMGLEERGSRMESQFYREPVVAQQQAPAPGEPAESTAETDPF